MTATTLHNIPKKPTQITSASKISDWKLFSIFASLSHLRWLAGFWIPICKRNVEYQCYFQISQTKWFLSLKQLWSIIWNTNLFGIVPDTLPVLLAKYLSILVKWRLGVFLVLSATDLFKYVWPISGHYVFKSYKNVNTPRKVKIWSDLCCFME